MKWSCTFALVHIVAGCSEEPPRVSNVQCEPMTLSVASPAPYTVDCYADQSNAYADANWEARDASGKLWADEGPASIIVDGRLFGHLTNAQAPAIGTMTITVEVDNGDDAPRGNSVSTTIEVVP